MRFGQGGPGDQQATSVATGFPLLAYLLRQPDLPPRWQGPLCVVRGPQEDARRSIRQDTAWSARSSSRDTV
jgi:hypothetical protein